MATAGKGVSICKTKKQVIKFSNDIFGGKFNLQENHGRILRRSRGSYFIMLIILL